MFFCCAYFFIRIGLDKNPFQQLVCIPFNLSKYRLGVKETTRGLCLIICTYYKHGHNNQHDTMNPTDARSVHNKKALI